MLGVLRDDNNKSASAGLREKRGARPGEGGPREGTYEASHCLVSSWLQAVFLGDLEEEVGEVDPILRRVGLAAFIAVVRC